MKQNSRYYEEVPSRINNQNVMIEKELFDSIKNKDKDKEKAIIYFDFGSYYYCPKDAFLELNFNQLGSNMSYRDLIVVKIRDILKYNPNVMYFNINLQDIRCSKSKNY